MFRAALLISVIALSPWLAGCDRSDGQDKEAEKEKEGAEKETKADAKAEAGGPCDKYATALCEKAGGDKSPTCSAIETTTKIMADEACTVGLEKIEASVAKIAKMTEGCQELTEKLCKDLGTETQTCAMVREKTPQMPPEQCATMMGEYDSVLAELKGMEERNKPLSAEKRDAIATGNVPSAGPADAKVAVVEFSDFQCPYCSRAADAITKLKEKYPEQVRFVFRQFPLSFHKEAHLAAQASLAAHEQGKFWAFHDLLFDNQKALGREDLEKHAEKVGLDMKKFRAALDEKTYESAVNEDMKLGSTVNVGGTPTVFVNGERVANATDYDSIAKAIDEALASKG